MSLGGEDEFFKFIKFLEDGKVGTLRRFMKILHETTSTIHGKQI